MGASASCNISGVNAAGDTSWGHWIRVAAVPAVTYTFNGTAVADGLPAPAPLSVGPLPKFAAGPPPTGITWTPLTLSSTGGAGSTATAAGQGNSSVSLGIFTNGFGCDMYVNADARAAKGGGTATASSTGTDPWQLTVPHVPGRKSHVLLTVTPNFLLAPAARQHVGSAHSGFRLFGSFGEIALRLDGASRKPGFTATLNPEWLVYEAIHYPALGPYFQAPHHPLSMKALEALFVGQHHPLAPVWQWNQAAPSFTFVTEIPPSVTASLIEVGIDVDDHDADDD
jgi:hypothetical protein